MCQLRARVGMLRDVRCKIIDLLSIYFMSYAQNIIAGVAAHMSDVIAGCSNDKLEPTPACLYDCRTSLYCTP